MPRHPQHYDHHKYYNFDPLDREYRFDDKNRRSRNYHFLRDNEEEDYRHYDDYRRRRNNETAYAWDPGQAAASEYTLYNYNDRYEEQVNPRGFRGHGPKGRQASNPFVPAPAAL